MWTHDPVSQQTVGADFAFVGVGLHSGRPSSLRLRSAPAHYGLRFVRRGDGFGAPPLVASWRNVVDTRLCTTLGDAHGTRFATIEHLLAALHGCGIDNALIEVDGDEIPVLDGSARPFVQMLQSVPPRQQGAPRSSIVVKRPIGIRDGERFVLIAPAPESRVTVEIDFRSAAIGRQRLSLPLDQHTFAREVAPARTFGFTGDLERLRQEGKALGGSIRNAILVDGERVMNPEGLRFADEFVRHKLLDLTGDLSLAGARVQGHVYGFRPGHELNTALVGALLSEPGAIASGDSSRLVVEGSNDRLLELLSAPGLSPHQLWDRVFSDRRSGVPSLSPRREALS